MRDNVRACMAVLKSNRSKVMTIFMCDTETVWLAVSLVSSKMIVLLLVRHFAFKVLAIALC